MRGEKKGELPGYAAGKDQVILPDGKGEKKNGTDFALAAPGMKTIERRGNVSINRQWFGSKKKDCNARKKR